MVPKDELDVTKIFRPTTGAFINEKCGSSDYRHGDAVNVYLDAPKPCLLERNTVDSCDDVDSHRYDAHLVDQVLARKVVDGYLLERRTEFRKRSIDSNRIIVIGCDPYVQVARCPWLRVDR